uniref:Uncharacterized protein n=1 Tax=Arundo donax TaxID=35708 RepID=A0A0A8Y1A7_ARUDO
MGNKAFSIVTRRDIKAFQYMVPCKSQHKLDKFSSKLVIYY